MNFTIFHKKIIVFKVFAISVDYKWILKIDFHLTNLKIQGFHELEWKAPKEIRTKSLTWETPLYVYKVVE